MKFICHQCIGDKEIKNLIQIEGKRQKCNFCSKKRKSLPFSDIAIKVDEVYRKYFEPGELLPRISRDTDKIEYEQSGDSPEEIIQKLLECEFEISEKIVSELSDEERYEVAKDGAQAFYDIGSSYSFIGIQPSELNNTWLAFQERVKFKRRYFDDGSQNLLDSLFEGIEYLGWEGTPNPDVHFNPVGNPLEIYRARIVKNKNQADKILLNPEIELNAPPPNIVRGGRLNPSDIPIFYGALEESTCVAEVRPNIGNYLVIGKFEISRPMKILDLTVFNTIPPYGSFFRPSFDEEISNWMFFRNFQYLISQPILPNQEYLEYIPTQIISEYLSNILNYDGIIYSSAQIGQENEENPISKNIAIFYDKNKEVDNIKFSSRSSATNNSHNKGIFDIVLKFNENPNKFDAQNPFKFPLNYISASAQKVKVNSVNYTYD